MMAENPDLPISFVFKPITSEEDDERPRNSPHIVTNNIDELVLIPNLYQWKKKTDSTDSTVELTTAFTDNIPSNDAAQ